MCNDVAPSDVIWKTTDDRLGYLFGNLVLIIRKLITEYQEGGKLYNSGLEQIQIQVRTQHLTVILPRDLPTGRNIEFCGH